MSGDAAQQGPAGEGVLLDLPEELWSPLLRALRRAVDRLPRGDVPAALRPFAGWRPDRLAAARPRSVIARLLPTDQVLRDLVAHELDRDQAPAVARTDLQRLIAERDADGAAAVLAVAGRWDELAVLAADAAAEQAARARSGAERKAVRSRAAEQRLVQRQRDALARAREQQAALRRQLEGARAATRRAEAARDDLAAQRAELAARVDALETALTAQRTEAKRRVDRLRRRLDAALAEQRGDDARARAAVDELEVAVARLRAALTSPSPAEAAAGATSAPETPVVPRAVRAAVPGRPCALPPGVDPETAEAVLAVLAAGVDVVLDGYNVSKDARGRRGTGLPEQRAWLLSLLGGVVARFRGRAIAVFDGSDPVAGHSGSPRGVRVVFTSDAETADERILAIVDDRPADEPLLVVSSDREVRAAAAERAVDVARAGAFLAAVG